MPIPPLVWLQVRFMEGVLQTLRIQFESAEAARQQEAQQRRRQEEAARMARTERLREYKLLVMEGCLTLRCPRCQVAFVDFDACIALTCGNKACGAAFCALCLQGEG